MSLLRRLLGGDGHDDGRAPVGPPATSVEIEAAEREHERVILREEAERLDDLRHRQLRYQQHAWTPPAQGSERRADDDGAKGD